MDLKVITGVIILGGVLIGSLFFKGQNLTSTQATVQTQDSSPSREILSKNVHELRVQGKNFAFLPSEIRVKKGETVRIVFENIEGFHDFKIDQLNVGTKQIYESSTETVEFVADKVGSFEYYCSVGTHRQQGMKGILIVE